VALGSIGMANRDILAIGTSAGGGPRTVGAVLTGTLGDGAVGLSSPKQCGGITVVQDPSDAAFAEMPTNALICSKPGSCRQSRGHAGAVREAGAAAGGSGNAGPRQPRI
jgi:hypothetical protein